MACSVASNPRAAHYVLPGERPQAQRLAVAISVLTQLFEARGMAPCGVAADENAQVLAKAQGPGHVAVAWWAAPLQRAPHWVLESAAACAKAVNEGWRAGRKLRILLVHDRAKLTPMQRGHAESVRARIEVWSLDRLQWNPQRVCVHIVPPQRRARAGEVPRHLRLADLPRVLATDAMVTWLGLEPGQVLASERDDGSTYFRLVV